MFKSVFSAVSEAGGGQNHEVWIRIFTTQASPPKSTLKELPELENFLEMMTFRGIDKSVIKKMALESNNFETLEQQLVTLLNLNEELSENVYTVISILNSTPENFSNNVKTFLYLFEMRCFIKLINQLPSILDKEAQGIEQNNLSDIHKFILLLSQSKNAQFDDFEKILPSFYDCLRAKWVKIFRDNTSESLRTFALFLLSRIIPLAELELRQGISLTFEFIISHFSMAISFIQGTLFMQNYVVPTRAIISGFMVTLQYQDDDHKAKISNITTSLLSCLPDYENIEKKDRQLLGLLCLSLYAQCSRVLDDDISSTQFNDIVKFIAWLILIIECTVPSKKYAPCLKPKNYLEPLANSYFNYSHVVDPATQTTPQTLMVITQRMAEICKASKIENVLISYLIDALRENNGTFSALQYQNFLGFVLDVVRAADDRAIAESFEKNWDVFINKIVFNEESNFNLQNSVCWIILRVFNKVDDARSGILTVICDFIKEDPPKNILFFEALFNSLYKSYSYNSFIMEFITSPCLNLFIELSASNFDIFDFLRHLSMDEPATCFDSNTYMTFIFNSFKNSMLIESALNCIKCGLLSIKKSEGNIGTVTSILMFMMSTFNSYIEKKDPLGLEIIKMITGLCHELPDIVYDTFFQMGIFESFTELGVLLKTKESIMVLLELFTEAPKTSLHVLRKFKSKNVGIYAKLASIFDEIDFDITKELFAMASVNTTDDPSLFMIRNPCALWLLLRWSKGREDEEKIITNLFQKSFVNFIYLSMLHEAHAVDYLIERLGEFQDDTPLTAAIGDLFAQICGNVFSDSDFNTVIKFIKDPSYKNPQTFLDVFFNFLKKPVVFRPNSYFQFNGLSTGIDGVNLKLPDTYTFRFTVRFEMNQISQNEDFITISVEKTENIKFCIKKNSKMQITRETNSQISNVEFSKNIIPSIWMNFIITICPRYISVLVNDIKEASLQLDDSPRSPTRASISFGNISSPLTHLGLPFEISPIELFDGNSVYNELIAYWTPRNMRMQRLYSVCQSSDPVLVVGDIVPYVLSVQTIVPETSTLLNIIPLYTRLISDDLPVESGYKTLHRLNQILIWCFSSREELQKDFNEANGTLILASYWSNLNVQYLNEQFISDLQSLFDVITDKGMLKNFTSFIWLNYSFIYRFDEKLIDKFFKITLLKIYAEKPEGFNFDSCCSIAISQTLKFDPDGKLNVSWVILHKLLEDKLSEILISIPFLTDEESPRTKLLTCCMDLVQTKNIHFIKILEEYDIVLPFVLLINYQIADKCILNLVDRMNKAQQESIALLMCGLIPENADYTHLHDFAMKLVFSFNQESGAYYIERPAFLPFLNNMIPFIKPELLKSTYNLLSSAILKFIDFTLSMLSDPLCLLWITKFLMSVLDVEKDATKFAAPYTLIISRKMIRKEEKPLTEFFIFCLSMEIETKKNFMHVFKRVLTDFIYQSHMEKKFMCDKYDLMWCFFVYTFFTAKYTNIREKKSGLTSIKNLPPAIPRLDIAADIEFSPCIRIDDDGMWEEESIVETLFSFIPDLGDLVIDVNERIHIHALQIMAYSIVTMIRLGHYVNFDEYVEEMIPLLENMDSYVVHNISSMLIQATASSEEYDSFALEIYQLMFNDDDDSTELQYFMFEDKMERAGKALSPIISSLVAEKVSSLRSEITSRLKIPYNEFNADPVFYENTEYRKKFSMLKMIADESIGNGNKIIDTFARSSKLIEGKFNKSLFISAGPWSKLSDGEQGLKAVNRISLSGARLLQSLVHDHFSVCSPVINESPLLVVDAVFVRRLAHFHGKITLTNREIVFIGVNSSTEEKKDIALPFESIEFIFKRKYGIEIVSKKRSYYLIKMHEEDVKRLFSLINFNVNEPPPVKFDFFAALRSSCRAIYQTMEGSELYTAIRIQEKWMCYDISTYEYIYCMNLLSGRSFADLENYPMYPSVINSSNAMSINLQSKEAFNTQLSDCTLGLERTLNFLSLVHPFNELCSKNEKPVIDPDYKGAVIPEFFTFPPAFKGASLPLWATDAVNFVQTNKNALESFQFGQIIHTWFDSAFKDILPAPHPERVLPNYVAPQIQISLDPQQIENMQKGIVVCSRGTVYNLHTQPIAQNKINISLGNIFCVSRRLGIIVTGNVYDSSLNVVDISTGKTRKLSHVSSIINCASVVDSRYILTGGSNCSVNVWNIATLERVQSTYYHASSIISVAANYDAGIVASIDSDFKLVIEMLCEKKFIRVIQLKRSEIVPQVLIFKSSTIVVVSEENGKTKISSFTSSGNELRTNYTDSILKQCCKCYTQNLQEYIAVLLEAGTLKVYSIPSLTLTQSFCLQTNNPLFFHAKRSRSLYYVSSNNGITQLQF